MTLSPLPRAPQGLPRRALAITWGGTLLCLAVLHAALALPARSLVVLLPLLYLRAARPHLLADGLIALGVTGGLALLL